MGEGRKGQDYWDTNFSSFSLPTFPFCCLLSYGCKHARTMSSSSLSTDNSVAGGGGGGVGAHAVAVVDGEEVVECVQHLTCQKKRRLSTTTLFVAE